MADLYRLPATALPPEPGGLRAWNSASIAKVANLGYPGFRHLCVGRSPSPAVVLLAAVYCNDPEVRLVEGPPWLAVEYHGFGWEWPGFVVALGQRVAERSGAAAALAGLREVEEVLERAAPTVERPLPGPNTVPSCPGAP
jgi:hypothetical protein